MTSLTIRIRRTCRWDPGESALIELNLSPALLARDFDGDTTALPPGLFTVSVENDIPANTALFVQVGVGEDEMSQAPGTLPTPDLSTGNGSSAFGSDEVIITNAQLQTLVQPGADEEVLFSLNTALGGNVFTVNNENVEYLNQNVRFGYDSATQTIVGFVDENISNGTYEAGDHVVFRLTALPGGDFRFDLLDQLDHNIFNTSGTGDARTLTIDLSGAIVATDFDGDVVNLGVDSIRVVVENDVPSLVVNPAAAALVVDETVFATDAIQPFTNFFIVNPGADEPAVVSNYALQTTGGPSGLFDTLTNSAVVLINEGGAIVGRATEGGAEVFRVTVDGSGNVTLNQSRAVVHNDPADPDEPGRIGRGALGHEPDHAARDDHRCRQRRRPRHGRHHGDATLRGRRSVDRSRRRADSDANDRRHRHSGFVERNVVRVAVCLEFRQ